MTEGEMGVKVGKGPGKENSKEGGEERVKE